ncbi:class A beta-lactamase-related serine hydrolase [Oceanobacillus piezotolerans]|uniref:Class A beta-lactamase-related serine hydrolase n=1 Tax=Oceanobacillus piezotolerans TaxID=2448030 RepID=A0A498DDT2_9BACI|nr:serine hydrolase domain-containing protein [Oceanobacillus piezotolerans]RLL46820.1 class A beta-lactamase-related serine hydrolase [Oceanobacillus piezotolerans]
MKSSKLDDLLTKVVADSDVPGVVAYVAGDDEVIYEGTFGKRNVANGEMMTTDTVFWIASMTKAVTSVAAMQLVEQGKLILDQPLNKILPELNETEVMVGTDDNGEPILRNPKGQITLRRLLTHTAGFTYHFSNENTVKYIKAKNLDMREGQNESLLTPLAFDPGEKWEYGINIDWVGKAIEAVSGKNLRTYFQEYIFTPLGMTDTDFVIQAEQRERLVSMHVRNVDELAPIPFEIPQEPEFFMGGGGLYSTARDYTTFLQMILHGGIYNGKRILETETVKEMCKNQIGEFNVTTMKSVNPTLANEYEAFPDMIKKWGLGFLITTEDAKGRRKAGSLSWAGLGNTFFWIDPTSRITAVILTQLLPFADQRVLDLLDKFEAKIYELINEKSMQDN